MRAGEEAMFTLSGDRAKALEFFDEITTASSASSSRSLGTDRP
jgi:hypothetical protein